MVSVGSGCGQTTAPAPSIACTVAGAQPAKRLITWIVSGTAVVTEPHVAATCTMEPPTALTPKAVQLTATLARPAAGKSTDSEMMPVSVAGAQTLAEEAEKEAAEARKNIKLYGTGDPMISYLEVIEATEEAEALLTHLRTFDTHETIGIPVGKFEIRRQREYTPEGWRRVED